ncbi:MAG: 2-polyprenyl-3-methyl-6-methoxy-1,4-benzoquinone monooxygenase [Betaproteobacteria bacterium]|nr:2-polyprenyl-3-methyl-6-methoxy-1,4-benzoquinone monooxygenase [Betaproteobacteria bacterium]
MLSEVGFALHCLTTTPKTTRPYPPSYKIRTPLTALEPEDRAISSALMRVNHVGEVCAQALYSGQSLSCLHPQHLAFLQEARREELDHLAWTRQRLQELGSRPSLLNPLWYAGAFVLGLMAGRMKEQAGLGFVMETERQVEAHLNRHMYLLPHQDLASRAIVQQMALDEAEHGAKAASLGGRDLPAPFRALMHVAAKMMTTLSSRF